MHNANVDTKICMQILHSGPLAISKELVAASPVRSRIGRLVPNEMSLEVLRKQVVILSSVQNYVKKLIMMEWKSLVQLDILFLLFSLIKQI